jgi:ribosomal protein S20
MSGIKDVISRNKRSTIVKEAKKGHDFGKKNTSKNSGFKSVVSKALKEYGNEAEAKKVAGAAFWKQHPK